ncbi:hypothetical protein FBZ98_10490 [Rhizobium sp. ERR 922]|uniref:hypothetical protein n=1 Tax=unclassified Rhizobium TaxID=2613769 RepID=UPI00119C2681|nr:MULTISPECIES: hypothetical protein [unclassified Rhizobium]TWB09609.1 hypothetical protein FBZ99_11473 [Rhizobium sp. ERR1071]TWB53164.1 hypothetical protein FBZ98_10490 [Rhizobium sp. ERR 922]TWB95871.1 hypothetical protein FBZ97_104560 [Rhizobium sp. ERR 942]
MAPAIAALVKGMLKDSTLSDQDKQTLATLIGTSLSSAVGAAVGGGEGGSDGAANYQYNYLTHEQAKELTDAEKALEACKASPTTCSDTYKAQLQSQVETLKNLDYQTTMSLLLVWFCLPGAVLRSGPPGYLKGFLHPVRDETFVHAFSESLTVGNLHHDNWKSTSSGLEITKP